MARWQDNEAHGGLYGVYMNKDGLTNCSQIQGFTVWKSFDYGIYFQVKLNNTLGFKLFQSLIHETML